MSDTDATQTRQAVAVDEILDFLDYEVGNDDHIFYDTYSELHGMVSELGYENVKLREERDMYRDLVDHMVHPDIPEQLKAENANLQQRITTQKQTIQAYRDESREWREVAERAQAENAKLRMFIDIKQTCLKHIGWCDECPYNGMDDEHDDCNCTMQEMISSYARELGVEEGA